ncbi:VOC family protein [Flavisphingomonas formosensis]|uniref:VOC family protein n=1 Tax=Flavisphingomonas formosensis TaxID=861534 RepID=UPI0012F9CE7A|nr:VOC family protein [Sphingomonas formosensis]
MSVAALAYIIFESPNADGWAAFLQNTVGLAPAAVAGEGLFFRLDDAAWRINVRPGATERFAVAGLELASNAQLDACVERLRAAGAPADENPALAAARGVLRLVQSADPCGNAIELIVGRTLGYEHFASPAGVSGFVAGDMGLGHVVLPAPEIEAARHFWLETIGLGLTDTMTFTLVPEIGPQTLYFMHADNARHHSVALFEAPSPTGLIHFMLEARTIDDVGRFIDRCERDGVHIASQFGRHSNDRMMSVYVMTPGGSMLEFGCDGLQIDWRSWIPTTSLVPDLWGHKFMGPPGVPAI